MKQIVFMILAFVALSCTEEKKSDFILRGTIDGLKKGTLYLEKQQDSTFIILDSLAINGHNEFVMTSKLDEPQILFLRLDKNDKEDGMIVFFADKGTTEVTTSLKEFNFNAKIKGSKQQEVLEEYLLMMSKFNDKNLDMIKENLESFKENDSTQLLKMQDEYDNLLKRKYLYTINFAVNHKDSEVAPYLAISEITNTSIKYLETIYDALEGPIKESLYGKQLKETIEWRKNQKAE